MATVAVLIAIVLAVVLVAREIHWSRAVDDLRRRLDTVRARMREGEELAHVGQLVSGLAQELKSPLQGMLGNTEVMLASAGPASTDDLKELQENAARAAGIVRNLLAFTETGKLSRRWQDVNDIVTHAAEAVRGDLEKIRHARAAQVRRSAAARLRRRPAAGESRGDAALAIDARIRGAARARDDHADDEARRRA